MRTLTTTIAVAVLSLSGTAFAEDAGKVWKAKCASCHGDAGDPKGKPQGEKMKVASMAAADWQKKFSDEDLTKATVEGVKREKDGVKQQMKGYKELTPDVVKALVAQMRSFKK